MSHVQAKERYRVVRDRNFVYAIMNLLEREYSFFSPKVRELIASDIEVLRGEHFQTNSPSNGQISYLATTLPKRKNIPGTKASELETVMVILTLISSEDLEILSEGKQTASELNQIRLVRLLKEAYQQGGILSVTDLSLLMSLSFSSIGTLLARHRLATKEVLPLKGYIFDQGGISHKKEIVALYEQGKPEPEIARLASHSLKAVENYITDYLRVKELLILGFSEEAIIHFSPKGKSVVEEYLSLIREYHPQLLTKQL